MKHLLRWMWPVCAGALVGACFQEPVVIQPAASASATESEPGGTTVVQSESDTTVDPPATDSTTMSSSSGQTLDDTSSSSGALDSSTDSSESTGCVEAEPAKILWVEDALVLPPMELRTAIYLPGRPEMARSFFSGSGSATFSFELDCPATVTLIGLVWDIADGPTPDNADSFFVGLDEESEWEWDYGCQTEGKGDMLWAWLPIEDAGPIACSATPMTVDLAAGPHELTFRNRESGSGEDFAAITALVITSDEAFDPTTLYDPTP